MADASSRRSTREGASEPQWIPAWVDLLGMPVWVTGDGGTIQYLNERAETLLGRTARNSIGRSCHHVICGRTPEGAPFCGPNCLTRRLATAKAEIKPIPMEIPGRGRTRHHVRVVIIVAHPPGGSGRRLVHCVVDDEKEERIRSYLLRVLRRSPTVPKGVPSRIRSHLTPREQEVLRLLSDDETLHGIAQQLRVSYPTVRNHVQHILEKLGVHSILEAVAFYLMSEEEN